MDPVVGKQYEMYAHLLDGRTPGGRSSYYSHFFTTLTQMKMCGDHPIFRVKLTIVRNDFAASEDYWGWHHADTGDISMIWHARVLLDMCFPYGMRAAIQTGSGHCVRLMVQPLRYIRGEDSV